MEGTTIIAGWKSFRLQQMQTPQGGEKKRPPHKLLTFRRPQVGKDSQ